MNKKAYVVLAAIVLLLAIGVWGYALANRGNDEPAVRKPQQNALRDSNESDNGGRVTKVGTFGCLEVKDTGGPYTMECALGLKQDDGTSYALHLTDHGLLGDIATGQRIEVTGSFKQQDSKYKAIGIIEVESITRL